MTRNEEYLRRRRTDPYADWEPTRRQPAASPIPNYTIDAPVPWFQPAASNPGSTEPVLPPATQLPRDDQPRAPAAPQAGGSGAASPPPPMPDTPDAAGNYDGSYPPRILVQEGSGSATMPLRDGRLLIEGGRQILERNLVPDSRGALRHYPGPSDYQPGSPTDIQRLDLGPAALQVRQGTGADLTDWGRSQIAEMNAMPGNNQVEYRKYANDGEMAFVRPSAPVPAAEGRAMAAPVPVAATTRPGNPASWEIGKRQQQEERVQDERMRNYLAASQDRMKYDSMRPGQRRIVDETRAGNAALARIEAQGQAAAATARATPQAVAGQNAIATYDGRGEWQTQYTPEQHAPPASAYRPDRSEPKQNGQDFLRTEDGTGLYRWDQGKGFYVRGFNNGQNQWIDPETGQVFQLPGGMDVSRLQVYRSPASGSGAAPAPGPAAGAPSRAAKWAY